MRKKSSKYNRCDLKLTRIEYFTVCINGSERVNKIHYLNGGDGSGESQRTHLYTGRGNVNKDIKGK